MFGFSLSLSTLPMWGWHNRLVTFPCYFPFLDVYFSLPPGSSTFPDQKALISLNLFVVITNLPSSFILLLFLSLSCVV
jgi:hypothetical protein